MSLYLTQRNYASSLATECGQASNYLMMLGATFVRYAQETSPDTVINNKIHDPGPIHWDDYRITDIIKWTETCFTRIRRLISDGPPEILGYKNLAANLSEIIGGISLEEIESLVGKPASQVPDSALVMGDRLLQAALSLKDAEKQSKFLAGHAEILSGKRQMIAMIIIAILVLLGAGALIFDII